MSRYAVVFRLDAFGQTDAFPDDVAAMVEALAHINANFLELHPEFPRLYESGVRYLTRPHPKCRLEEWKNAAAVLKDGFGDCKDLTAWLLAELSVRDGIDAEPYVEWIEKPRGVIDMHIKLRYPDGTLEDPSERLGMRRRSAA